MNLKQRNEYNSNLLEQEINNIDKQIRLNESGFYVLHTTRLSVFKASSMLKISIAYVSIYIGIIFLITSAAILALQQLSQTSDNAQRYKLLNKLGADKKTIYKSNFIQTLIYFSLPLLVAIIHSVVALKVIDSAIKEIGASNLMDNILISATIFFIIYTIYFIATYTSNKSIIKRYID